MGRWNIGANRARRKGVPGVPVVPRCLACQLKREADDLAIRHEMERRVAAWLKTKGIIMVVD